MAHALPDYRGMRFSYVVFEFTWMHLSRDVHTPCDAGYERI